MKIVIVSDIHANYDAWGPLPEDYDELWVLGDLVNGCATRKWRLGGAARLPVVLKATVEVAAAQGDDGIGSSNRPEHAGLFEP